MKLFSSKKEETAGYNQIFGRELLTTLISGLEEAVVIYSHDFEIVGFNSAAEKIFEIKAAEVMGKTFSLSEAKNFKSKIMAQVMFPSLAPAVTRETEPGSYPQILNISLENPPREFRVLTNRIAGSQGQILGFVKVVKDRTRELELLRAKNDFITIAAHQLRTPTTALNWALDNLAKEKNLGKEVQENLVIARKTAHNLLTVINELVNIAQIEEGKFGYQFKKINLVNFLKKILADADPVAKEYQVKIYFQKPQEENITVSADISRLGLAISNLIDNAVKYNVPNGEVIVKIRKLRDAPYVETSIKDTGIGIPEKDLTKLFNKFFRASNVEKFAVSGSGLGLYLTKNIVARHGGKIWAESVVNRGSSFYFTLPTDPKLIPLRELEKLPA